MNPTASILVRTISEQNPAALEVLRQEIAYSEKLFFQEVLKEIRGDSQREPERYLDEVVVPGGGE